MQGRETKKTSNPRFGSNETSLLCESTVTITNFIRYPRERLERLREMLRVIPDLSSFTLLCGDDSYLINTAIRWQLVALTETKVLHRCISKLGLFPNQRGNDSVKQWPGFLRNRRPMVVHFFFFMRGFDESDFSLIDTAAKR